MTIDFLRKLTSVEVVGNKIPIICNQENFILRENTYKIRKALADYQFVLQPAVKGDHDSGRPKNGMFIAFPVSMRNCAVDVSPGFWRVQAVKFKFQDSSILLINSYFPTDSRQNDSNNVELDETLGHIRNIITDNEFDSLIWAGDINAEFFRASSHTTTVQDTIADLNLTKAWDRFKIDFTYCHEYLGESFTSILDHFLWNETLDQGVLDAGVIHCPGNKSDHAPIYCVIDTKVIQPEISTEAPQKRNPSWKRASDEEKAGFKESLENKLSLLNTPQSLLCCKDTKCRDSKHLEDLDQFILDLLDIVQCAAEECLPIPGQASCNKKVMPGWTASVKPFKDQAFFWHQIWHSCGRPLNSEIHKIMKKTRNRYHYEYKKCRKAREKIQKSKLLEACLGDGGDLFLELKRMRKTRSVVATSMDGVQENIEEHFRNKYQKLYNSADDSSELLRVQIETENLVDKASIADVERVTPEIVKQAVRKLKPGKSDPVFSFSTDCFKNATDPLFVMLSTIIQSCLIHSHVTQILLLATLVPLIKDKLGSTNTSKNYRSIAISSILLKIIDWTFITLYGSTFALNDFQFAYQEDCSTTMCTWAVLETVDYFMKSDSEVFTCAMDMTAAFDLTLHSLLFSKMIQKGFPPIFIRLFIFIYMYQTANVRWNGALSSEFPMSNGVRQGAILSAIAYCFYMEDLFALLKHRRAGCWVMDQYHGIFGYSDDNWLLAPSLAALQDMLQTCEEYAHSQNLKFSTDSNPTKCKTKLMAFLKTQRSLPSLSLCGNPLPWVDRLKHLGNTIANVVDGCQLDLKVKNSKYIDKNNTICQELYFAHPQCKFKVNSLYNNHFTGSQLWLFGSKEMEKLESTYNRSIKLMYSLPWPTHMKLLEPLTEMPHIRKILTHRYISFIRNIQKSNKKPLRNLLNLARSDVRSVTGSNLRYIMLKSGKTNIDEVINRKVEVEYHKLEDQQLWKVAMIEEIIEAIHGENYDILEFLCVG